MTRVTLMLLFTCLCGVAQQAGRLTGTVADPTGAVIPGARVSLYLADGAAAVLESTTNSQGIFDFTVVRPDVYRLEIESPNFARYVQREIRVETGRQVAITEIRLALTTTAQSIEVVGAAELLDTASAEVAQTVTQEQIRNLPVLSRQISGLFALQAGVSQNLRSVTVINGMRASYSNLLVEGINIQDSVRTNPLDFIPNRITIAQVSEFTVSTTNSSPTIGGAASTIMLTIPSGGNPFHGSLYWYNRNSAVSANDWFNNRNGVARASLNLNQPGGTISGPIQRDKLFFFGNYEGYRLNRSSPVNRTILTPTARQGVLRYGAGGAQQFNVLQASNLQTSPFIQTLINRLPVEGNNNSVGDGLNTTGYRFNARGDVTRDNVTAKGDYHLSTAHVISASYAWNREILDRPDLAAFYSEIPPIFNDGFGKLFSVSHRWTPTPTLTNELRGGFNLRPGTFQNREAPPAYYITGTLFSSPVQTSLIREGRDVNMYSLQDNANWVKGRHRVSFGFQTSQQRVGSYGYGGTVPSYGLGISTQSPYGFALGAIPGANSTEIGRANSLLATLAGLITSGTRTFNLSSRTSGFVPGAPFSTNLSFNNYALYAQDHFKLRRDFTLTLGLRWDYFPPVNERDALLMQPVVENGNGPATLLGNANFDFHGNAAGRPFYKKERNNFAPSVAFAWDVTGDGKTSVRGGFNIAFLNDNTLNSLFNVALTNPGLSTDRNEANLTSRADAPPPIPTPPFSVPISLQSRFNLTPSAPPVLGLMDPNLATPYVEQWNMTVQRDIKGWILEGRYVGNHAVKVFRQIDYNQIDVSRGGFLDDFKRARNNAFLAQAAGLGFNPAYNANVAGSQPLTFFPRLPNGGLLTNATLLGNLRTGEVGTMAQNYQSIRYFPSPGFSYFPNPLALYSSMLTNLSHSNYNAGQFEVRRRTRSGMQFQANYTFSRAIADTLEVRGLEAQLDNANPRIERSIANYDQRHAFKMNHYYPLPLGEGRLRFGKAGLNRLIQGWAVSGLLALYSGSPVGLLSGRGTLNRGARSGGNTVDTNVTYPELQEATGLFMTGNGPYWIDPKHIYTVTGQGIAPDGAPPFTGQLFFNPQPGSLGGLQRRILRGPAYHSYDFSLSKVTRFAERHTVELHADFFNVFNHPNFYLGDQNVNSATFGRINSQNYSNAGVGPRLVQFGLYYRF